MTILPPSNSPPFFLDEEIGDDFAFFHSIFNPAAPVANSHMTFVNSPPPVPTSANGKRRRNDDESSSSPDRVIAVKRSPSTSPQSSSRGEDDCYYSEAFSSANICNQGQQQQQQQQQQQHSRRLWVKDRSTEWWDRMNSADLPEDEFRKAFRMSKATFDYLCEELGSAVAKEDTTLRAAIPVRQRVAVCIWRLATGEPLRLVSKRFGLGISTCHKLVLEVCAAIKSVLMPKALIWPSNSDAIASNAARFEAISGVPGVVGAIYTTHIPIIAPKVSVAAYFNRRHTERNQKTSYSVTVQGVVDANGVFTDVCIGWPGSMPDDQVLEKSALYQRAISGMLNNKWIVGGVSFPLMDWILVPYTQKNLTWTQHTYNEKIGEAQMVAKEAFARMKGRWGCLQKRTEMKLQDLPVVLGACCVLHNVCELRNEEMDPELKFELVDDEMVAENGIRSVSAMQARERIAHNLLHRGGLGGGMNFL